MDTTLDAIQDDLREVDEAIRSALRVEGRLMSEVAEYICQSRGKMMRPMLTCLTARALESGDKARRKDWIAVATSLELLHTATLLHDDVIDRATLRRGRPTVNAKWDDDVAILMADYLYACSFDQALNTLQPKALRLLTDVTREMTIGEMFQIETRNQWLRVEDYLRIIRSKTALLFSACAGLGVHVVGGSFEQARQFTNFGLDFGMAFQLTDDALDYVAQGEKWGKRIGSDLSEGKQTLPLLHTLHEATESDRATLLACLNNGRDFNTVHAYVTRYQGIEATRRQARHYCTQALSHLDGYPDNPALAGLRSLAQSLAQREY